MGRRGRGGEFAICDPHQPSITTAPFSPSQIRDVNNTSGHLSGKRNTYIDYIHKTGASLELYFPGQLNSLVYASLAPELSVKLRTA